MLSRGQCGPHTRFSRNRSCTQLRTSRGYEALDATAPSSGNVSPGCGRVCPPQGYQGWGLSSTHTHTGIAGCPGRVKLALAAPGAPGLRPLPSPHTCSGLSSPLPLPAFALISSLRRRSWSPSPVTKSHTLSLLPGLARDRNSGYSDHRRGIPGPGRQPAVSHLCVRERPGQDWELVLAS